MTDLDKILNSVKAPKPSELLKARILQAAKEQSRADSDISHAMPVAANDNIWKRWGALAAIALVAVVIGMTVLPSTISEPTEAELWAENAKDIGYTDLYAWVQGDEDITLDETQNNSKESSLYRNQIPI